MKKFKAAIIGLGNIGFRFNLDPLRKGVWSHAAAYDTCKKTELCGAVEVDREKTDRFIQYYKSRVPVFRSVKELMSFTHPDIVSICTPTNTHFDILKTLMEYPVRAILCEKPIAGSVKDAKEMVGLCAEKGVALAINHTRRWDVNYIYARDAVRNGDIGKVGAVQALYSGQVFNIGTHLVDTISMIIGKDAENVSCLSHDLSNSDPDVSGWILFGDNVRCSVLATGKRDNLMFEIDVIGDDGRIRISENGEKIEKFLFVKSKRYSGYKELHQVPVARMNSNDRFVKAIDDIVSVISGKKDRANCSGLDGLAALSLCVAMRASAKDSGKPRKVRC